MTVKRFRYVGPHDEVEIPGVGAVTQGASIDIEDPDVSKGLEGQAHWEHVPLSKAKRPKTPRAPRQAVANDLEAPPAPPTPDQTEEA